MAPTHDLRNGNAPARSTSNPSTNPKPSIAEQAGRWLAERATTQPPPADNRVRIVLPRQLYVEPFDLEKFVHDDPMFPTLGAAIILGVSVDLLRKWRQRGQGPQFYQFGIRGPVLYSLSMLNVFKAAHLVIPRKKGRKQ